MWAEEVLRDRGGELDGRQLYAFMRAAGKGQQEAAIAAARRELDRTRSAAQQA